MMPVAALLQPAAPRTKRRYIHDMADRKGGNRPRSSRITIIVAAIVAVAFLAYYVAYYLGGLTTPDAEEVAEEAPATEQPVDDFDAADDDPADDTPGAGPAEPAAEETPPADGPGDEAGPAN
jgi:hypothetical protein